MIHDRISKKSESKKKRRTSFWKRCFLWLLLGSILFFGFGFLSRLDRLQVHSAEFENIIVTDNTLIQSSIETYLDERYLFPRSNTVWFSAKKLEQYLMQEYPRLGEIQIKSDSFVLKVWGSEREGFYLWCGKEVAVVTLDTQCYFADDTGFIFDIAPFFAGSSYVRLYGDVDEKIIRTKIFGNEVFEVTKKLEASLDHFDIGVQAITMTNTDQLVLVLFSNNPITEAPHLKHFMDNDTSIVVSNIDFSLRDSSVILDIRNNYDRLEYIDTRFKDQVVYKFFNEKPDQPVVLEYEDIKEPITENLPVEETLPESSDQ